MNWEKLSSKYLFEKPPWLVIRQDAVRLQNGVVMDAYYVLEYPDWVNVIALTDEGLFVMVRQYRHALGKASYELSAGVCDDGDEDALQTAQRELLEETGFAGGEWEHFTSMSANPGTHTNLTHCYLARGVKRVADQNLDRTEEISVHLLTLQEISDLLNEDQITQALHAAALWKYMALYG